MFQMQHFHSVLEMIQAGTTRSITYVFYEHHEVNSSYETKCSVSMQVCEDISVTLQMFSALVSWLVVGLLFYLKKKTSLVFV